jgi:hypothetical protein
MGFHSLAFPLQYSAMCSKNDFTGIGGDGGVGAMLPFTPVRGSPTPPHVAGEEGLAGRTRIGPLGEALAGVANDSASPSAVGFRLVVHGRERELRAELRAEVYRIGREALVNACRHSRATAIETEVEYRAGELRIAVRDNGCGINPRELRWGPNGHCGLQGMRERAERIGARLKVRSRASAGTEVELSVPSHVAFQHQSPPRPLGWLARIYPGKTRAGASKQREEAQ